MTPAVFPYWKVRKTIAPSKMGDWDGSIREGERFTNEQMHAMVARGLIPAEVETLIVRRSASAREVSWGIYDQAPVYEHECPVIGRQADTRVKVISPSGAPKLVWPTGDITKRARKPAKRWGRAAA